MTLSIRKARDADAALLPAIEASAGAVFRTVPGLAWIADDAVMPAEAHLGFIRAGTVWVAVDGQKPCGFLTAEHIGDVLHIWQFAVAAEAQRRGVGTLLMDAAIGEARERGQKAVTLTTFRDLGWNEGYYARLGFRTLGARDLDGRLRAILAHEVENGLPGERRCAMRLTL